MATTGAWAQTGLVWSGRSVKDAAVLGTTGVREILVEAPLPAAVLDTLAQLGIGITAHTGYRYVRMADSSAAEALSTAEALAGAYAAYPWFRGVVAATDPSPDWAVPAGVVVARTHRGAEQAPALATLFHTWDTARIADTLAAASGTVFFPEAWLRGPHAETVHAWLRDPAFLPVVPAAIPVGSGTRPGPIVLLVVVALWLALYRGMPLYRKMTGRYVGTHTFFVADVMQRRARLAPSTAVLWLLFAGLSGIMAAETVHWALTDHGRAYLGTLGWPSGWYGWFLLGAGVSLAWDLAMALWLFAAGTRKALVDQALTLVVWPRHFQFPIVVVLVVAGGGSPLGLLVPLALVAFPLTWTAAFPLAMADMAGYAGPHLWRFRLLTLLPYFALTLAVLIGTDFGGPAFEPLRLALTLR